MVNAIISDVADHDAAAVVTDVDDNYDAVDVEYDTSDVTDVVGIDVCNHKINEV